MKRAAYGLALAVAAFLLAGVPSQAGAHGWHRHRGHVHHYRAPRVVVGFSSGFWWGPRVVLPAPPLLHVRPPRVIVRTPPVYVERAASSPSYWYYCESAGDYYPSVSSCPEPWVKVLPRTD